MKFYNILHKTLLSVLFSVFCYAGLAQLNTLSPYSRFGIGELEQGQSVFSQNLGGAVIGLTPYATINYDNPASYSYLVTPVFQTSFNHNYTELDNGTSTGSHNQSTFKEIAFGSALGKKWGFSLGVVPFSAVGYDLSERSGMLPDSTFSTLQYKGSGGFSKAFVGASKKRNSYNYFVVDRGPEIGLDSLSYLNSSFSFGVNMDVIFGSASYERNVIYDDYQNYYHRFESSSTSIGAPRATFGFVYKKNLKTNFDVKGTDVSKKNELRLQLAGTYSLLGEIKSENNQLTQNALFFDPFNITPVLVDTVAFAEDIEGTLAIPNVLKLGMAITWLNSKKNYLEFSVQYNSQDWSNFTNSLSSDEPGLYGQSNRLSAGIQYTPKPLDANIDGRAKFLRKSIYQIGVSQSQNYIRINDQNLSEYRVGLGCSIPFLQSKTLSRINLGMDFGIRGNTNNGLIEESSFNAYLGFNLMPNVRNDRWFQQSKYQ